MSIRTLFHAAAAATFIAIAAGALPAFAQDGAHGTSAPSNSAPTTGSLTPEQIKAIEQIVHDYLLHNPQVILDAVEKLEQQRHDEAQKAAKSVIAERRDELLHDPDSPVGGNPNGNVTVVEFFDYRCPYCKQVEPSLAQLRRDDHQLRFVYKEFPILGPDSVVASHAALAARKQNKYQQLHDALIGARGRLDEATVLKIAGEAGLDVQRLKKDMHSPDIDRIIARNMALARALGINGTPGFIVGDQLVPGAVDKETLENLIAEARK